MESKPIIVLHMRTQSSTWSFTPVWPSLTRGVRNAAECEQPGELHPLQSISEWLSKMANGKWHNVTANGLQHYVQPSIVYVQCKSDP